MESLKEKKGRFSLKYFFKNTKKYLTLHIE